MTLATNTIAASGHKSDQLADAAQNRVGIDATELLDGENWQQVGRDQQNETGDHERRSSMQRKRLALMQHRLAAWTRIARARLRNGQLAGDATDRRRSGRKRAARRECIPDASFIKFCGEEQQCKGRGHQAPATQTDVHERNFL